MKWNFCRLCGERKLLQRRCHIIPRFIQEPLRRQNRHHRLWRATEDGGWTSNQDEWAKYWFCGDCENNIFNRLGETPVSLAYSDGALGECDPKALRHLTVSILFRVGLTLNDQFHASGELLMAVRDWKRWLKSKNEPLCYPVCTVAISETGIESFEELLLKDSIFVELDETSGVELLLVFVPGIVFVGLLSNRTGLKIEGVFDEATLIPTVLNVVRRKAIAEAKRMPKQPPPDEF